MPSDFRTATFLIPHPFRVHIELNHLQISPTAHPYRWMMLFGVWLLYFGFGLTASSLAPLVRPITSDLQMSYAAMGAVLGA